MNLYCLFFLVVIEFVDWLVFEGGERFMYGLVVYCFNKFVLIVVSKMKCEWVKEFWLYKDIFVW